MGGRGGLGDSYISELILRTGELRLRWASARHDMQLQSGAGVVASLWDRHHKLHDQPDTDFLLGHRLREGACGNCAVCALNASGVAGIERQANYCRCCMDVSRVRFDCYDAVRLWR